MSDFEYKILGPPFTEKKLNEMGKLGWQLVAVQDKKFYFMRSVMVEFDINKYNWVCSECGEAITDKGACFEYHLRGMPGNI